MVVKKKKSIYIKFNKNFPRNLLFVVIKSKQRNVIKKGTQKIVEWFYISLPYTTYSRVQKCSTRINIFMLLKKWKVCCFLINLKRLKIHVQDPNRHVQDPRKVQCRFSHAPLSVKVIVDLLKVRCQLAA